MLFREGGFEFAACLLEHSCEIDGSELKRQVRQIKAGDFKKFVNQLFETLGFVEGDSRVPGAQLRRNLRFIAQKRQVADHACQRRLKVMREIYDEVVFSLLGFPHGGLAAKSVLPHRVEPVGDGGQQLRQLNGACGFPGKLL